jgi:hypothetical protein
MCFKKKAGRSRFAFRGFRLFPDCSGQGLDAATGLIGTICPKACSGISG